MIPVIVKKSGGDPTHTTRQMTTTPIKAELPTSEIPLTFKDGKIQANLDLSIDILNEGTIGFKSEEVTKENLLNRVCTVDLYPEAIASVAWTLRCVLAAVTKKAEQVYKETGKEISTGEALDVSVVKYVMKFLEVCNEQFNQDMDKVKDFNNCINQLSDLDIQETLKICYEILEQLEEFLPALFNFAAEGLMGTEFDTKTFNKLVIDSQTAAVIALCRGMLGDVV